MATERRKASKLVFVITTLTEWDEQAVERLADEFQRRYDGNLAVDQAYLERVESIERWLCPECGEANGPADGNCLGCGEPAPDDVELED